jgi:biopolymer transport protein ExbD
MRRTECPDSPQLWIGPIVLDRIAIYSIVLVVMAVASVLPESSSLRAIEIGRLPSRPGSPIAISRIVRLQVSPAGQGIRISWRRGDSEPKDATIEHLNSVLLEENRKADEILLQIEIDRDVSYDHVVRIIDILRETGLSFRFGPASSLSSFGLLTAV